jgi:hypothetical protein
MQRDFVDTAADSITEDAARSRIKGLISEKRSANTVREVWLSTAKTVFAWAVRQKEIGEPALAN